MNTRVVFFALALLLLCAWSEAGQLKRIGVTPGKPIKAIYVDWHLNWNAPQQSILDAVNAGFNVIIISFYLSSGSAADMAQAWAALDDATKQSTIATAHSKGAVVTVSLGGATDSPWDKDPTSLGKQVASWVIAQHLDGVDFDLENLAAGFTAGGMNAQQTVNWIATVSQVASQAIGSGAVISHAPQGPYFGPIGDSSTWAGATGGYSGVHKQAGQYITFYNVQFYNQGATCYTDFNGLFLQSGPSCSVFPNTSVAEIAQAGVPLSKIVVGKPVTSADASNGWVSGSTLASFFQQAQSKLGWNTGVMGWVWNDPGTCQSWIQAIYGGGGSNSGVTAAASNNNAASNTVATYSTVATAGSTATNGGSTTGGAACNGKEGWFCVGTAGFEYCPGGVYQPCSAGTKCVQTSPTAISCE
jgi:chitinase